MLKKNIAYTDYNGVARNETFYFNLSKAELAEMELSTKGGLTEYIQKIIETDDTPMIIAMFKDLIIKSYGEKSVDGKQFIKRPELAEAFSFTDAYSTLFMELATDADAAAAFVNGIIPADLAAQVAADPQYAKQISMVK